MNDLLEEMAGDRGDAPSGIDQLQGGALDKISRLAGEVTALEQEVADAESVFKAKQKQLRTITDERLPEALEDVGMEKVVMRDGSEIAVKQFYSASIPKDSREEAFAWLRANGFGDLIKLTLSVVLDRDAAEEQAHELRSACHALGLSFNLGEKVESATLRGWLRELVESGSTAPDSITSFIGRRAVLKRKGN
jgi:hypothetical protein|tara:strand:- start:7456 stop:8034 length:579 start_codon:yes stop_codon:yes gene_type:complete